MAASTPEEVSGGAILSELISRNIPAACPVIFAAENTS